MNPTHQRKIIRAIHLMGILVFMVFIVSPLLQMNISTFHEGKNFENRKLTEKPKLESPLTLKSIRKYRSDYENYLNDHFGFRNTLVKLNSLINTVIFKVSPNKLVILGKSGWLFYDNEAGLKDYRGLMNFTAHELSMIQAKMTRLNDWFRQKHILFIVLLAPNKHSIYPEFLPGHLNKGTITRADQLEKIFRGGGIHYIDLRSPFLRRKSAHPYPLYYMTDSHWNPLGAFLAYEETMKLIRSRFDIPCYDLSDFNITNEENGGNGDLAGFINMTGHLRDAAIALSTKLNAKSVMIPSEYGKDTACKVIPDQNLPRFMLYGDSFMYPLIQYFSESFSKSIYLGRNNNIDLSIIDKEKPDVFVFEFVERNSGLPGIFLDKDMKAVQAVGWIGVLGAIPSDPTLAWNAGANKLQMVVQTADNSIWVSSFNSSGVFNNDWASIPGAMASAPALAWNPMAKKLQMVVRASNDSIWAGTFNSGGVFNNDQASIPGRTASRPALAWNAGANKLQIVVQAANNSIWTSSFSSAGIFNNDWVNIPGSTASY